ncbi:Ribosome 60S biogenesis N-terminal [Novymonas esmeraldas]|uniref:Ribosome 60S biogenesis N-terminal n=1 Tax=Novymonas esmeraldas TaxID=1808958 RepID=A0AAW0EKR9_9TRYP
MALVEPLVGHLLSKYKETVLEGLSLIRHAVEAVDKQGGELAVAVGQHEDAMQALRATLLRHEYLVPTLQTLTAVLTHLTERSNRISFTREVLRGECAALFRKTLATLSDSSVADVTAALQFLTAAARDAPLLVLARLRSPADANAAPAVAATASSTGLPTAAAAPARRADVPLHLAAFRLQLTYTQRRLRLARLGFLVQLVTSPMHNAVTDTICSHGFLTHLLEDAAELLREGTSAGVECALAALRVVRELFVQSRHIAADQKRGVLLAQRNIFRLLVRALEFDPVADNAAAILYAIVDETIESPADYASTRVESLEEQGMPNYLLFFLLRQLRPKASERMARLALHVLQRAPDLVRPYFIRVSGHLAEDGNSHGVAPSTARIAVLNMMTRAFLSPMPYHLAAHQIRLEPVVAKTSTFYTMCPRDVADEICPAWVAEYVHRLINGSTNLLMLALAIQLTHAALMRARCVLPLVQEAQNAARANASSRGTAGGDGSAGLTAPARRAEHGFSVSDLGVLQGSDDAEAEVWDTFNAQVRHHLLAALPSREEFWHRMTQQLHRTLTVAATPASSPTSSSSSDSTHTKTHVVVQRLLLLMNSYVDVFDLRAPWLSAVPAFLPDLARSAGGWSAASGSDGGTIGARGGRPRAVTAPNGRTAAATAAAAGGLHPITAALEQQNDILKPWPAASVAVLCQLLSASQRRRVPMMKMHHINMSQAVGIGEWPLLLSVLLWVSHHRPRNTAQPRSDEAARDAQAVAWAAQLLLWTVHSITIHSTCTVAEAHLWLSCLTPNTVPLFLHVLNQLLMRSLSKAADRVTHELRGAEHGVLAAAAQHFIDRAKEKQQQQQPAGGDAEAEAEAEKNGADSRSHAAATRGGRGRGRAQPPATMTATTTTRPSAPVPASKASSASVDLWGTHLQASLTEFEGVVARVVQLWKTRERLLAQTAASLAPKAGVQHVSQQQRIDVLVLADRQRGLARTPLRLLRDGLALPAAQIRAFALTLRSPVLPQPEDEVEMALIARLSAVVTAVSAPEDDDDDAPPTAMLSKYVSEVCAALQLPDGACPARAAAAANTAAPLWFSMNAVCWHAASVLQLLARRSSCGDAVAAARRLAVALIQALLSDKAAVAAHMRANADGDGTLTGLLLLLLVCTRTLLLPLRCDPHQNGLSADERAALGRLCLDVYGGTLGVQDRLRYAVCLTLHYLGHVPHTDTTGGDMATDEGNGAVVAAAAVAAAAGAEVPDALVRHRFLLRGHSANTARTPEVEMLAWHLDTLTEEDVTRMALHASSRLHNCVYDQEEGSSGAADLLGAVFPELRTAGDADVADLERLVLGDVLDLRYLVPLLHRVAALPAIALAHLPTGRAIPVLLKALTVVDAPLRAAAAAALSALYIPKGALRVVVTVARLKLAQLRAAEQAAAGRHPQRRAEASATVPRLPTPLATLLILSIRPLGRYDDALHHHLVHFLVHIKAALDTPLPFAYWATTPPLATVSVPLMLERQEALQRRSNRLGGVTQASAADVTQELRRGAPPQLAFLVELLCHACEVPQDGAAVMESNGVDGLLLLCSMLTASDVQRASYVQCLRVLCTQSAALTELFARSGHMLAWTVSFLWVLCREYGKAAPSPYSGPTFTTALELLRVLCTAVGAAGKTDVVSCANAVQLSTAAVEQLLQSLRQLRAWVVEARVTARDILDIFDDLIRRCSRTAGPLRRDDEAGASGDAQPTKRERAETPRRDADATAKRRRVDSTA